MTLAATGCFKLDLFYYVHDKLKWAKGGNKDSLVFLEREIPAKRIVHYKNE